MKYSMSVEFIGAPNTIELLALEIQCEDERSIYAEFKDFDESTANDWAKKNILPNLKYYGKTKKTIVDLNRFGRSSMFASKEIIAKEVKNFFGNDIPEFCGPNAKYGWVIFCFLFGSTESFPEEWPMWCINFKRQLKEKGFQN